MKRLPALTSVGILSLALIGAAPSAGATPTGATSTAGTAVAARAAVRTLSVPSQYRTISAAVAAAQNYDTISVSPGVYRETVSIYGKYITLRTTDPNPLHTTIVGQGGRSAIEISNVPRLASGARTRVFGFHLYGTSTVNGLGGGLTLISRADADIEHNIIEKNSTTYGGGILVFRYSSPVIQYNVIRNNHASIGGGGIMVGASSSPRIYKNTITGNVASGGRIPGGGSSGAGLYITGIGDHTNAPRSYPLVGDNEISGNAASFSGGGIALGQSAFASITHNHISANRAAYGGGVHIEDHGAGPVLSLNTIEHNEATRSSAYSGSGSGGGVSVFGESRPNLQHNVIQFNGTSWVGGGVVVAEGSAVTMNANIVRANIVRDGSIGGASGGGLFVAQSTARVTNNDFTQNTAPNGGGVAVAGAGTLLLVNNDVIYNKAASTTPGRGFAGGFYVGPGTSMATSVTNNLIAYNNGYQVAQSSYQAVYNNNQIVDWANGMFIAALFPVHVYHTAAAVNAAGDVRAAGTIATPPTFAAGSGNLHLARGSAGINQGTNVGCAGTDYLGVRRPVNRICDIGIYEQ